MSEELILEEVEPDDRDEIIELSKGIWGGRDYLPEVIDDWFEEGGFYKGVVDSKIVAIDKYTWLDEDTIWLEGLRVHPDLQGRGYARQMVDKFMDIVEDLDYDVLKFLTVESNEPILHMAEEAGFEMIKKYDFLRISKDDIEEMEPCSEDFSDVEEGDPDEVFEFVKSTQEFEENEGQYIANWISYDIDEDLLTDRVEEDGCYVVKRGVR